MSNRRKSVPSKSSKVTLPPAPRPRPRGQTTGHLPARFESDARISPPYLTRTMLHNVTVPGTNAVELSCSAKWLRSEARMRMNMQMVCDKYSRISAEMKDEDHDLISLEEMKVVQFGTSKYSVFSEHYVPRNFGEFVPLSCPEEDPEEEKELEQIKMRRQKRNPGDVDLSTLLDDMESEYNQNEELRSGFFSSYSGAASSGLIAGAMGAPCCGKKIPFATCVKSAQKIRDLEDELASVSSRTDKCRVAEDFSFCGSDSGKKQEVQAADSVAATDWTGKQRDFIDEDEGSLVSGFVSRKRKPNAAIARFKVPKVPRMMTARNSQEDAELNQGKDLMDPSKALVRRSPRILAKNRFLARNAEIEQGIVEKLDGIGLGGLRLNRETLMRMLVDTSWSEISFSEMLKKAFAVNTKLPVTVQTTLVCVNKDAVSIRSGYIEKERNQEESICNGSLCVERNEDSRIEEDLRSGPVDRVKDRGGMDLPETSPFCTRTRAIRTTEWVAEATKNTWNKRYEEAQDVRQGERLDRQLVANARARNEWLKMGYHG